ncbi:hypothetical protein [Metabacillus litoralis]|nr:hypothetical protein [Metabacillus litoralis]
MNKNEIKEIVETFKEQVNCALNGSNQPEEIKKAVYFMLKSLNIQIP